MMNNNFLIALGCIAAGVVGGVLLDKQLNRVKESRALKCSEELEKIFGKTMFTNKFTLAEAKEWFLQREKMIHDGNKGVIMRVRKESVAKLDSRVVIELDMDNYLLLSIYKDGSFLESLLVKYVSLDDQLVEALKDGALVIEQ